MTQPWLHSGMRLKIEQIKRPARRSAADVVRVDHRPSELAKELFTHQGFGHAGRLGEKVQKFTNRGISSICRVCVS